MRSSKFTFKKTKEVVNTYRGVCIDLTEEEARALLEFARWRVNFGGHNPDVGIVCEALVGHISEQLK